MRYAFLLLFLVPFWAACDTASDDGTAPGSSGNERPTLFPVERNDLWGYIDRDGEYVWVPTD
jgi:hypothetical protein